MKYNIISFVLLCSLLSIGNIQAMDENNKLEERDLGSLNIASEEERGRNLTKNSHNSRESSIISSSSSRSRSQSPTPKSTQLSRTPSPVKSNNDYEKNSKIFHINDKTYYCFFTKQDNKLNMMIKTTADNDETISESRLIELDFTKESPVKVALGKKHTLAIQQNLSIILHEAISPVTSPSVTPPTTPRDNKQVNNDETPKKPTLGSIARNIQKTNDKLGQALQQIISQIPTISISVTDQNNITTTVTLVHKKPKNITPIVASHMKIVDNSLEVYHDHTCIQLPCPFEIQSNLQETENYFLVERKLGNNDIPSIAYVISKENKEQLQNQIPKKEVKKEKTLSNNKPNKHKTYITVLTLAAIVMILYKYNKLPSILSLFNKILGRASSHA